MSGHLQFLKDFKLTLLFQILAFYLIGYFHLLLVRKELLLNFVRFVKSLAQI